MASVASVASIASEAIEVNFESLYDLKSTEAIEAEDKINDKRLWGQSKILIWTKSRK